MSVIAPFLFLACPESRRVQEVPHVMEAHTVGCLCALQTAVRLEISVHRLFLVHIPVVLGRGPLFLLGHVDDHGRCSRRARTPLRSLRLLHRRSRRRVYARARQARVGAWPITAALAPPPATCCSNNGDGSRVWKSGFTITEFHWFFNVGAPMFGSMPQYPRPQSSCPTIPDE